MPLIRNEFLPQSMTTVYTSPSGMTDLRTGQPYYAGGLVVGGYFDLTEAEAQAVGPSLHQGRYRFVQVDSGATATNIKTGTIGLMKSLALGVNFITSYDLGLATGNAQLPRAVVFLAPLTATQVSAGAYVFVQELGDASVLANSGITAATAGIICGVTTGGTVTNSATEQIGISLQAATGSALFRVMLNYVPIVEG